MMPSQKLAELKMRKEQIAELQKANAGKDNIFSLQSFLATESGYIDLHNHQENSAKQKILHAIPYSPSLLIDVSDSCSK